MSDLPLDRFQPVPLAEVLMRAEYLTRVDRKYVLNPEVAVEVLEAVMPAPRCWRSTADAWLATRASTSTPPIWTRTACVSSNAVDG